MNISVCFVVGDEWNIQCKDKVFSDRQKRDRLSENVVIGMDYFGKAKIVCQCDSAGARRVMSKNILASKRGLVVKVRSLGNANEQVQEKNHPSVNEEEPNKRHIIYSQKCCKIDLTNPPKLYSYPFTLRLPDQTYSSELRDPSSHKYQSLKNQLITG
ncbi:Hypothetical predicted protein, partial [Paramuricea clavata]